MRRRAALPNGSGLEARGRLCRTVRVSWREGGSAERFGSQSARAALPNGSGLKARAFVVLFIVITDLIYFSFIGQRSKPRKEDVPLEVRLKSSLMMLST